MRYQEREAVRSLHSISRPWKKEIALVSVFRIIASVAGSLQLVFMAQLVAGMVIKPAGGIGFVLNFLYLSLAAVGKAFFNYQADREAARLTEKVTVDIRSGMLATIVSGGIPRPGKASPGSVSLSFLDKADAPAHYLSRYIPQLILCAALPFIVLFYLFSVNWVCALFILFTAPAIPVFMVLIGRATEAKSKAQWQTLSRMGADFFDRLRGVTTLYLFGQLKDQSAKVRETSLLYAESVSEVLRIAFLSSAVLEFFSAVIIAGAAIYIGLNMMHYVHWGPDSAFSLGNGLVVLLLVPEFFMSLKTLGNYYHDRTRAIGAVMDLQESGFLQAVTSLRSIKSGLRCTSTVPMACYPFPIIFRHVSFAYEGSSNILSDFSLQIEPYEKIWIRGANGSGKTTILSLLSGWHAPRDGQIWLGAYRVQEYEVAELAQIIGWVGQQATIFDGTLRSNILMGSSLTDDELWDKVLEPATLAEYVRGLPLGLDTWVAEEGKSISGGERQKIALARVLVREAPILVLDEPLAHLDASSSAGFLAALDKIGATKTIIIVGHGESYLRLRGYREIDVYATTE